MSTMLDDTWLPGQMPVIRMVGKPSEIVPGLWIGDRIDGRAAWNRPGWTVIDVREFDTAPNPKHVVAIPLLRPDTNWNAGRGALEEIAEAIDVALANGDQILIHCWQGIERSPLSVAAWLVTRRGYTLDAAYQLLQDRRGVADRRAWLTKKARKALRA